MFANLLLVTILIIGIWVAATAYYLYTSDQHTSLKKEIESVQALLDKNKRDAA
jgi:Na+/melibiose symporter-like transporter